MRNVPVLQFAGNLVSIAIKPAGSAYLDRDSGQQRTTKSDKVEGLVEFDSTVYSSVEAKNIPVPATDFVPLDKSLASLRPGPYLFKVELRSGFEGRGFQLTIMAAQPNPAAKK